MGASNVRRSAAAGMAVAALLVPLAVGLPSVASAAPQNLVFSTMAADSHTVFDSAVDHLLIDGGASATKVVLTEGVDSLGVTFASKTVWLDGASFAALATDTIDFADASFVMVGDGTSTSVVDDAANVLDAHASTIGVYLDGLRGADTVIGGSGSDVIVGDGGLGQFVLVSQANGVRSPIASSGPTVSADGDAVAFNGGWSPNFGSAPGPNPTDVIVKHLGSGIITNEHRDVAGVLGLSGSGQARLSADGSTLVFQSSSTLVANAPADTVYAASTNSNAVEAVSTSAIGGFADHASGNPDVSSDGRYVVFTSNATNLTAAGGSATIDCYLKDRVTGTVALVSHDAADTDGNADCVDPRISPDGAYVAFSSSATNLEVAGDHTVGATDVFLWTRADGMLVNITGPALGSGSSDHPDVTVDAAGNAVVVFDTAKALLVADTNGQRDVYRFLAADASVARVSTTSAGAQVGLSSDTPSVSLDGKFVTFRTFSDALVAGDANGWADVVVKSMSTGAVAVVSRTTSAAANGPSERAEISLGGDWIAFQSSASSLSSVAGTRAPTDVYLRPNPLAKETLAGGLGNDTYLATRADTIVEALNGGIDMVRTTGDFALPANVENLTLLGAAVTGTGNNLDNRILGAAGVNHLNGGGGNDRLDGGEGGDVLTGGTGNDTYIANASNDVIQESGPAGDIDTVVSGVNWTLGGLLENLTLTGAAVNGSGNSAANRITGNALINRLTGGSGNDRLDGGAGGDTLVGGSGDDTYVVDAQTDIITEVFLGGGIDAVVSGVNWTIAPSLEHLTLTGTAILGNGNAGANRVIGNAMDNRLVGNGGNDVVSGGSGSDALYGGSGDDVLTGGAGSDRFVLTTVNGTDTLSDFAHGVDHVEFAMSSLAVGDGDMVVEGGVTRPSPGGFAPSAELVVLTHNAVALTPVAAATAIGSAAASYSAGARRIFVVDNGINSAVFLFVSATADAAVSAGELTQLAVVKGVPGLAVSDFRFVA